MFKHDIKNKGFFYSENFHKSMRLEIDLNQEISKEYILTEIKKVDSHAKSIKCAGATGAARHFIGPAFDEFNIEAWSRIFNDREEMLSMSIPWYVIDAYLEIFGVHNAIGLEEIIESYCGEFSSLYSFAEAIIKKTSPHVFKDYINAHELAKKLEIAYIVNKEIVFKDPECTDSFSMIDGIVKKIK